MSVGPPAICQVAFCLGGKSKLWEWYRDGFHFLASGATVFMGPPAAKVNGLPWPLFPGHWLLDSQGLFQLEFFRFLHPRPKLRCPDERLSDHGYRMVGIHTVELDGTLERLQGLGRGLVGPMLGEVGARRVCCRDPEGNLVELLEGDPLADHAPPKERPDVPATVRFVTLSVADLEQAKRDWVEAVGLTEAPTGRLHGPEHETMWDLGGAARESAVLQGGGVLIELVEYTEPVGRPLPESHRICDQGLMNVAVRASDKADFDARFSRLVAHGARPTSHEPLEMGVFRVMYFDLPSGANVELLYPRRRAFGLTGFRPSAVYAAADITVDASPGEAFSQVSDHEALGQWTPFRARVIERGAPERNAKGAVRRVRVLGLSLDERVVEWWPPERYTYRGEGSWLIRRHRGDVVVRGQNGGSLVRWAIRLRTFWGLGWLVERVLRRVVRRSLARLQSRLEADR
jgi:catechol 2,3-dioxygenase-like lactoylglutathione lyase family enzyme